MASDGGASLLVAVLPKHWRHGPARHVTLPSTALPTSTAVLYEGDVLVLDAASPTARVVLDALSRADRDAALFDLVSPGARPATELSQTDLADVVGLFGLARRLTPAGSAVPVAVDATGPSSEAFAWARLVAAATQAARQVRQGYVEREERVSPLRGRVVMRDVPQALAEHRTALLCRYDEMTIGTAAQRVVATALDVCARPADSVTALIALALGDVQEGALGVRRLLRDIPSMPSAAEAILVGRRLTLPRESGIWRTAHEAALAVLERRHETPRLGRSDIQIAEVVVHPSRLWESLLERAARIRWPHAQVIRPDPAGSNEGVTLRAPWRAAADADPGVYPDLVIAVPGVVWCADAKYKVRNGLPARSDLYQMFAYSHLTSLSADAGTVTRCALLYPASTGKESGTSFSLERSDSAMTLDVATLPWPSADEARLPLEPFVRRLAAALPELSS